MSSLQHVNPTVKGIRESAHSGLQSLAAHVTQEIAQVSTANLYIYLYLYLFSSHTSVYTGEI